MLSSVRISVLFGYFFITITILTVILCCKISKLDYRFGLILSEINYEKLYLNGLQPKTNTTEKDTASACLIIKDDNPRLIEWIAYHYQVLPLRHLVITSDPSSLTSPKEILDRWRRVIHDLEITEWDEEDYNFNPFQAQYLLKEEMDESRRAEQALIDRQYAFYGKCAMYLKKRNRTWVFNIDSDEYVAFNNYHSDDPTVMGEALSYSRLAEQLVSNRDSQYLGVPLPTLKHRYDLKRRAKMKKIYAEQIEVAGKESKLRSLRNRLPHINEGNILDFINQMNQHNSSPFHNPCYLMPRLWISSIDHSSSPSETNKVHSIFDESHYTTLRFFHHAEKGGFPWNTYSKPMFDVSRIGVEDLIPVHVHRGPSSVCPNDGSFLDVFYSTSLLRVNHYAGLFESYFRTQDERKVAHKLKYDAASKVDFGSIYDAKPWLMTFVENVGLVNAAYLLQGIGNHTGAVYEPNERLTSQQYKFIEDTIGDRDRMKERLKFLRSHPALAKRKSRDVDYK